MRRVNANSFSALDRLFFEDGLGHRPWQLASFQLGQ
jgi:hypothetical protein